MSVASPFEDLPSDASMKVLSEIHDLTVRSNELIGFIQGFQDRLTKIDGAGLLRTLEQCKQLLKEQVQMSVTLVERQCLLDEHLRKINEVMSSDDD